MILTDYIFILVLALSTLFGFARGLVRESFTILNLTLASYATYFAYPSAYEFFAEHLTSERAIQGAAVFGSFIVFWMIIMIINSFLLDALSFLRGGFLDRILGTAFGLIRGTLIVILVYVSTVITVGAAEDDEKLPTWLKEAQTLNYVKMYSSYFMDIMPEGFKEMYADSDKGMMEKIVDNLRRRELLSDAEAALLELGFTQRDLETILLINEKIPEGYSSTLTIEEIAELDQESIKYYGEQLVADYVRALREGKATPIPQERVEALAATFQKVILRARNPQLNNIY